MIHLHTKAQRGRDGGRESTCRCLESAYKNWPHIIGRAGSTVILASILKIASLPPRVWLDPPLRRQVTLARAEASPDAGQEAKPVLLPIMPDPWCGCCQ